MMGKMMAKIEADDENILKGKVEYFIWLTGYLGNDIETPTSDLNDLLIEISSRIQDNTHEIIKKKKLFSVFLKAVQKVENRTKLTVKQFLISAKFQYLSHIYRREIKVSNEMNFVKEYLLGMLPLPFSLLNVSVQFQQINNYTQHRITLYGKIDIWRRNKQNGQIIEEEKIQKIRKKR